MQQSLSFSLMRSLDRSKYTLVAKLIAQLGVDIFIWVRETIFESRYYRLRDARAMQTHIRFSRHAELSPQGLSRWHQFACVALSGSLSGWKFLSSVCHLYARAYKEKVLGRHDDVVAAAAYSFPAFFLRTTSIQAASGLLCIGRPSFAQLTTLRLMAA